MARGGAMDLLLKSLAALVIGFVAFIGAQTLWFRSVTEQVRAPGALNLGLPQMKPVSAPQFANTKLNIEALHPKIDPNIGRAGMQAYINQKASEAIRAGQNIPRPPSIP